MSNHKSLTVAELDALDEAAKWFGPAQALEIDPDDATRIRVSTNDDYFPGATFAEFGFDDAAQDVMLLGNASPVLLAMARRWAEVEPLLKEYEASHAAYMAVLEGFDGVEESRWRRAESALLAALRKGG